MSLESKFRSWEDYAKGLEARLEQAKELVDSMLDDCSANDVELYQNLRELRSVLESKKEASS